VAVVTVPAGQRVAAATMQLSSLDQAITSATPVERLVSYATSHNQSLVSEDRRTTFILIYPRVENAANPTKRRFRHFSRR
jgi:hypothetical protein